ncbi:hypothetical protein DEE63_01650, partial [Burkholderia cepacia]|uniref:hypothetical protein n=1 Tax=Burkholderia cepacia TaxID=292 RepID=UPI001C7D8B2B|nr:hypothetical protein [Burkholderia cepacia]
FRECVVGDELQVGAAEDRHAAVATAPGAGWLWANAGGANAAVSASSAQTILLMANAKTLCFILFPLARSKTPPAARRNLVNSLRVLGARVPEPAIATPSNATLSTATTRTARLRGTRAIQHHRRFLF